MSTLDGRSGMPRGSDDRRSRGGGSARLGRRVGPVTIEVVRKGGLGVGLGVATLVAIALSVLAMAGLVVAVVAGVVCLLALAFVAWQAATSALTGERRR